MPFTIVAFQLVLRSDLKVSWNQIETYLESVQLRYFCISSARDGGPRGGLRARMIFYNGEDPATVRGGLLYGLGREERRAGADQQGLIEQGWMRRPSSICVRATSRSDTVTNVRVGGDVVPVIDGKVTL